MKILIDTKKKIITIKEKILLSELLLELESLNINMKEYYIDEVIDDLKFKISAGGNTTTTGYPPQIVLY